MLFLVWNMTATNKSIPKSLREESSDRAFEEEVMLGGFSTAPVKNEGGAITFDDAQETYTARYTHETIALAFSITEEAIEDNPL